MSLNNNDNIHEPPLKHKWLQKLRAYIYRSPLYLVTLKKHQKLDLDSLPSFLASGQVTRGYAVLSGQFPYAGRTYQTDAQPWTIAQDDIAWQGWVHGFSWLDDLLAVDDVKALVKARQLVADWIALHGVWTSLAWRADVIADRLISWMAHADTLTKTADPSFIQAFYKSLSLQASHLSRSYFKDLFGFQLLQALRGQLYVSLFIQGFEKNTDSTLERLSKEFDHQILPDGGHISRCPTTLIETLGLCLEIIDVLKTQKIEIPEPLSLSVDRMAPMVRTLRHGDGGLGLFHGGQESDANHLDDLLERTENQGQPLSDARHSGFQRIEAGRTILLMDVAPPPDINCHPSGHAAPLSLEVSCGEERLLVNCGAVMGGDPNWQEALAATAAHNSLSVDDKNCLQLIHGGGLQPRFITVNYERFEENGQVLIDANHDAYKETMGLIHHRSVYLNKTGDDLRVEDKLIGSGGSSYAISLHLHPDVHASIVQDRAAALLKLQNGAGWHLRVQGGKLDLRESIYAGQPGSLRHTDQIVIQGPLRGEGATVKWRLSRIGGS